MYWFNVTDGFFYQYDCNNKIWKKRHSTLIITLTYQLYEQILTWWYRTMRSDIPMVLTTIIYFENILYLKKKCTLQSANLYHSFYRPRETHSFKEKFVLLLNKLYYHFLLFKEPIIRSRITQSLRVIFFILSLERPFQIVLFDKHISDIFEK